MKIRKDREEDWEKIKWKLVNFLLICNNEEKEEIYERLESVVRIDKKIFEKGVEQINRC